MRTNELRQPNALEDFLSGSAVGARVVSAKAAIALDLYRPDPFTGKQQPGTSIRFDLPSLDEMIIMLKGCYYLVSARARTGKSAFAMQVADAAIRQLTTTERVVVIFSAEMDAATLSLREACAAEGLSYWLLVQGKLTQAQYDTVSLRLQKSGEQRYYLDESSAPTLEHMAAQLSTIAEGGTKIGLVIFDYLQLGGELDRNESLRINKISRGLKALAKRFDCPVLALGQLNRNIETRTDGQPGLSDLMYGGEQDPDGIIILHRPWLTDMTKPKELVEVWVAKHRHGPGGRCFLAFDDQTMRFRQGVVNRIQLNGEAPKRKPVGVVPYSYVDKEDRGER
jgi:replicative DNA helicase